MTASQMLARLLPKRSWMDPDEQAFVFDLGVLADNDPDAEVLDENVPAGLLLMLSHPVVKGPTPLHLVE